MEKISSLTDDPLLNLKKVSTASGKKAYRANCKKILGEYYIKDEECVEVDGKWYRKDAVNLITFNYSKNKWVLISNNKNMIQGIVGFKDKDTPVIGYFDPSPCEMVKVVDSRYGKTQYCISAELAEKYCLEDISSGIYYYNIGNANVKAYSNIRNIVDNKQKGYNIEDNVQEMASKIEIFNNYMMPVSTPVMIYSKLLGDISFGMESESIRGYLPEHIQNRTGIVICRDGSLHDEDGSQGPEYTSIPMKGAKGVQAIINFGKEASPRNIIDKHCAFHLHLGNLPTSRTFLVALYRLCYGIQDEVFQMFPFYKNDEKKYAGKDKNYCKKLTRLSIFALRKANKDNYNSYIYDNYVRIFTFLSNGHVPCKDCNRKLGNHPKSTDKWNRTSRYYWINFMNVIFSKRNTVEFRIHTGTMNPQKMVSWLFICNAIVKTAMNRTGDILKGKKITLNEVLDYYANNFNSRSSQTMSAYLKAYVQYRKEYFKQDYEKGDFISEKELIEDKTFSFSYPSISEMFK